MATILRNSARRGLPLVGRQLLNSPNKLGCSAVFSIENKRSVSQHSPEVTFWFFGTTPVRIAEETLAQLHEVTGLPWWASIIIYTIGLRACVTFPLGVLAEKNTARIANLEPEAKKIRETLKEEVIRESRRLNVNEKRAKMVFKRNMNKQIKLLMLRNNCHPARSSIATICQLPIWISLSFSLRDMAATGAMGLDHVAMATEGFLWITNLTKPDAFLIVPVITSAIHLANIELYNLKRTRPDSKLSTVLNYGFRGLSLFVIYAGTFLPSAVTLYWISSAAAALAQNLLLTSPKVRRLVGIPLMANEDPTPFTTLWRRFQTKILRRRL